jgi:nitrile hydratase
MITKFKSGDLVRVKVGFPPGHFRTPFYIQGKIGRVETIQGSYRNPESLAYGGDGLPKQVLYLICFDQKQVWEKYEGSPQDKVLADIYEHWLEPI